MGELGVLAGAERRVERQKGQQPMLERSSLGRGRDARERLQARIDLQCVGGDRHGRLAALAQ